MGVGYTLFGHQLEEFPRRGRELTAVECPNAVQAEYAGTVDCVTPQASCGGDSGAPVLLCSVGSSRSCGCREGGDILFELLSYRLDGFSARRARLASVVG